MGKAVHLHNEPVGGGKPLGYSQGMLINAFEDVDEIPPVKRGEREKVHIATGQLPSILMPHSMVRQKSVSPPATSRGCRRGLHYPAHNKLAESHGIFFRLPFRGRRS